MRRLVMLVMVAVVLPVLSTVVLAPSPARAATATPTPDPLACPGVFPDGQATYGIAGRSARDYWLFDQRGDVAAEGSGKCLGSLAGTAARMNLQAPIVGMAVNGDSTGYWLVAYDGGVFNFGNAALHGSLGGLLLNAPIVGMAANSDGSGYWLVGSDGGVFAFGNVPFLGSTGNMRLNAPIVGMAATPDGGGYWLVAADGGIFTFGDAGFYGSAGNVPLRGRVVGMTAKPDGTGYWLVASDGGVFNYNAPFQGSAVGRDFVGFAVGIQATLGGTGYRVATVDGNVFNFGTAQSGANPPYFGGAPIVPHCTGSQVSITQAAKGAPQVIGPAMYASFEIRRTAPGVLCSMDGAPPVAAVQGSKLVANFGIIPGVGAAPVYMAPGEVAHFSIGTFLVAGCTKQTTTLAMVTPRDQQIRLVPTGPFQYCSNINVSPVVKGPYG